MTATLEALNLKMDAIVESMCMTMRHDYGIEIAKRSAEWPNCLSSGMTATERDALRHKMRQLVDHHFRPALIAALQAEQGQEPVVICQMRRKGYDVWLDCSTEHHDEWIKHRDLNADFEFRKLYTTPPAEQWVSVKERLPEEGTDIFIEYEKGKVRLGSFAIDYGSYEDPNVERYFTDHEGEFIFEIEDDIRWCLANIPPIDSTDAGDKTA